MASIKLVNFNKHLNHEIKKCNSSKHCECNFYSSLFLPFTLPWEILFSIYFPKTLPPSFISILTIYSFIRIFMLRLRLLFFWFWSDSLPVMVSSRILRATPSSGVSFVDYLINLFSLVKNINTLISSLSKW